MLIETKPNSKGSEGRLKIFSLPITIERSFIKKQIVYQVKIRHQFMVKSRLEFSTPIQIQIHTHTQTQTEKRKDEKMNEKPLKLDFHLEKFSPRPSSQIESLVKRRAAAKCSTIKTFN